MAATINYPDRPEMIMTSRESSELYFAALAVLEMFEQDVDLEGFLTTEEEETLDRLQRAVEEYGGTDGNHDQPK